MVLSHAPQLDAAIALEALDTEMGPIKVLILSDDDNADQLIGILEMGVHGFGLSSKLGSQDLVQAVSAVNQWGAWLCPASTRLLISLAANNPGLSAENKHENGAHPIAAREREVLKLYAAGASEEEISQRLFLARSTVKTYLQRTREKLGASSRAEAVSVAIQRGLLPDRRALLR